MGNSEKVPAVVTRPILLPALSTNHRLPSGPVVIPRRAPFAVGTANSVTTPAVVIRPILLVFSVNHSAPSGPVVMKSGPPAGSGRTNSVMLPKATVPPISTGTDSEHHRAPSGAPRDPSGKLASRGAE